MQVSMIPTEPLHERAKLDLPSTPSLVRVVCAVLECLPFLEGSADTAVAILSELIKGTPCAPHLLQQPL
jgi:hypothetical protein